MKECSNCNRLRRLCAKHQAELKLSPAKDWGSEQNMSRYTFKIRKRMNNV